MLLAEWEQIFLNEAMAKLRMMSPIQRAEALIRSANCHANMACERLDEQVVARSLLQTAAEKLNQAAKLLEE